MIAFFPELYEDELAYSWFSRYYTKSGYLSLRYALDDLYVKRYVNPDTEFVNELRPEVKELVIKHCGMENLILGHTMFSSYGRFLPDAGDPSLLYSTAGRLYEFAWPQATE